MWRIVMNAWRKHFWMAPMAAAVFLLAGCSQPAPKVNDDAEAKKEPAGPAESVTAKTALWPMYTSARNWTKDFVVLRLASKEVPGFKNEAGKAAMWEATFASPGQHEYRVYTNSIAAHPPDIYKGVSIGRAIPWAGVTRDVMPVQLSEFNVDSDAAYATATADAGAWLKKNPGKPLSKFELGNAFRFQAPVWYFMWGDKKLGYTAFVNATTGKIVKAK
jgi:hypothetical protein